MPYNIFLFPLVGGYLILTQCALFKHDYPRLGPQRLLFSSAIVGIVILSATLFVRAVLENYCSSIFDLLLKFVRFFSIPFYIPLLWTSLFSFVFAILFSYGVNFFTKWRSFPKIVDNFYKWGKKNKLWSVKEKRSLFRAIDKHGDELERLLIYSSTIGNLIQITLKNNKVYVGHIAEWSEPQKTNYIEIFPKISGYRKSVSKKLEFTTHYEKVLEKENEKLLVRIIIKKDEILTATIFYPEIYDKFQELAKTDKDIYNKDTPNFPKTQPQQN